VDEVIHGVPVVVVCPACKQGCIVEHYEERECGVLGCKHRFKPDRLEVDQKAIEALKAEVAAFKARVAAMCSHRRVRHLQRRPDGSTILL
jgi:hypothetical protein